MLDALERLGHRPQVSLTDVHPDQRLAQLRSEAKSGSRSSGRFSGTGTDLLLPMLILTATVIAPLAVLTRRRVNH